jgi:hypothetical protein
VELRRRRRTSAEQWQDELYRRFQLPFEIVGGVHALGVSAGSRYDASISHFEPAEGTKRFMKPE